MNTYRSQPLITISCILFLFFSATQLYAEQKNTAPIIDGKKVSIEYTLQLTDGTVVDTNVEKEPLTFKQGGKEIIPSLEKALEGLKANDTKQVKLNAQDAFGQVDPKAFVEVKPEDVPESARVAGMTLVTQDPQGNRRTVRVHEVFDDKIVLDFNHPLAGKDIILDVRVISVE